MKNTKENGFNTDDGIRRAAIHKEYIRSTRRECFNTDDGIRRAAIISVGIPGCGKTMFQYR